MINPCQNCTDRHYCCWADCDKYKSFRAQIELCKAEKNKTREADNFRADYVKRSKRRAR